MGGFNASVGRLLQAIGVVFQLPSHKRSTTADNTSNNGSNSNKNSNSNNDYITRPHGR